MSRAEKGKQGREHPSACAKSLIWLWVVFVVVLAALIGSAFLEPNPGPCRPTTPYDHAYKILTDHAGSGPAEYITFEELSTLTRVPLTTKVPRKVESLPGRDYHLESKCFIPVRQESAFDEQVCILVFTEVARGHLLPHSVGNRLYFSITEKGEIKLNRRDK